MNEITLNQFKNIAKYIIKNNVSLVKEGKKKTAIELVGSAGLGKTSAVMQIGEELGMNVIKINLSQTEELGDFCGFPLKQYSMCSPDGEQQWVSEKLLNYYMEKGYHVCNDTPERMSYAVPKWVPTNDEPTILLLDDWTRTNTTILNALMELIDRGEYISWKIPTNTHIILSANPDNGEFSVSSLDIAQKTRYVSFNIKFDIENWAEWAEHDGLTESVINFCLAHPEVFNEQEKTGINPRTVVTFANTISSMEDLSTVENLSMINLIAGGCFTDKENSFGKLFAMFIHNKLDKLISPKDLLMGKWETIESQIKNCVYDGDTYRPDIASILTTRLLNYIDVYFEKKGVKSEPVIERIVKIVESKTMLFTEDLVLRIVSTMIKKYPQKTVKLMSVKSIQSSLLL